MATYFEEERKKPRWESGQALLHRETHTKEQPRKENLSGRPVRENLRKPVRETSGKTTGVRNSYGTLQFLKREKKRGHEREGLSLEAFEAPGTPLHSEKEKHLERSSMKRILHGDKQMLFSSEVPLRSQALFYDLDGAKKGGDFLECMKQLLHRQNHRTLQDVFGFLDQEPEQKELDVLRTKQKEYLQAGQKEFLPEETGHISHRIDELNGRLLRKKARERQLLGDLKLMLNQRTRKDQNTGSAPSMAESQVPQKTEKNRHDDSILRRLRQQENGTAGTAGETEQEQTEENGEGTS
ncbi:hypothetical protein VSQ32_03930 [Lachnospiraceae bacterium KK002]